MSYAVSPLSKTSPSSNTGMSHVPDTHTSLFPWVVRDVSTVHRRVLSTVFTSDECSHSLSRVFTLPTQITGPLLPTKARSLLLSTDISASLPKPSNLETTTPSSPGLTAKYVMYHVSCHEVWECGLIRCRILTGFHKHVGDVYDIPFI